MGFTNVRTTKDLVEKYGPTKGCLGCKHVRKEINYYKGHSDECRKRFLEISNEPGNESLKARLDQSFERATRKYSEAEEEERSKPSDKKMKTQDTRTYSKQQASSSSSHPIRRENKREEREEDDAAASSSNKRIKPSIIEQTGTKRTASKIDSQGPPDRPEEPDAKVPRDESNISALEEVCLLYTSPSPRDQRGSRMPSSA